MYSKNPLCFRAALREFNVRRDVIITPDTVLCGRPVRRLTLRHWCLLEAAESPFLACYDRTPNLDDIAHFLWVVSTRFRPHAPFRRWRFARGCRRLDCGPAVVAIRRFMTDALQDEPPVFPPPPPGSRQLSFPEQVLLGMARVSPGIDLREVVDMPLAQIFMFMEIARRAGKTTNSE